MKFLNHAFSDRDINKVVVWRSKNFFQFVLILLLTMVANGNSFPTSPIQSISLSRAGLTCAPASPDDFIASCRRSRTPLFVVLGYSRITSEGSEYDREIETHRDDS